MTTALAVVGAALGWMAAHQRWQATQLRFNQERLQLALGGADEALWDWDLESGEMHYSDRAHRILGHLADSRWVEDWLARVHPHDLPALFRALRAHMRDPRRPYAARYRLRRDSGGWRWVESRGRAHFDRRGRPRRMVGVATDVSERVQAEQALRDAAAIFEQMSEAVMLVDAGHRIIRINPAFTRVTGYTAAEIIGKHRSILYSGRHDAGFYQSLLQALEARGHWSGEVWERRRDGAIVPVLENVRVVRDRNGRFLHYLCILTDITVLKGAEERMRHLAHHDALTGLANRLQAQVRLTQAIARAQRHRQRAGVLYLDLDRFKSINDTLGHAAGDQLLITTARRLKECVRAEDTVARLGGDEFLVILEELEGPDAAVAPAEKIIAALSTPVRLGGRQVRTSTSIGISCYPDDGATPDELLRTADAAMYVAKQQGRGSYRFHTAELSRRARERAELEAALQLAAQGEDLRLHYQPKRCLRTGTVIGMEALLRWCHPERGVLLPGQFIRLAEGVNLSDQIGRWVLSRVFEHLRQWQQLGLPTVRVAINLTAGQVASPQFLSVARQLIERHCPAVQCHLLELEVPEAGLVTAERSRGALEQLTAMGVGLTVDNFGVGEFSLNALRKLPVQTLNIDRSVMRGAHDRRAARAALRASVALGHELGLQVLAEGVECEPDLELVREAGCDAGQGYLLGRPLPPEQVPQLLKPPPPH